MIRHTIGSHSRLGAILAVAALTMVACGGSGDDSGDSAPITDQAASTDAETGADDTATGNEPENGSDENGDDGSSSDGNGPVDGALVSLLSFDFGLFAVERGTGDFHEVTIDGVGFTDRQNQPILVGNNAYTLTFTPLEGQSSSHTVGVSRFDRATGEGAQFVEIGADRTDDESPDLTSFTLLGADQASAWVQSSPFAESDPTLITYTAYDVDSGAETASLTNVVHEESGETGECSDGVRDTTVMGDGQLIGLSFRWPVSIDGTTGEVTPLVVSCLEFDQPSLLSVVGAGTAADYFVVDADAPLDSTTVESLAGIAELSVSGGTFVEGDGSLWWIFNTNVSTQVGDEFLTVIAGGVVQFDMTAGEIVNVYPLADAVGEFLPEEEFGDISTLSQMDLQYLDGSLWIMDWRKDQPLRRVDATTGTLTEIAIPLGEDYDSIETRLVSNDPEAIWLDVSRRVAAESDDESSFSLGFIDQIDIATNTFVVSVSQQDILGF